jgi:hypothetical protein
MRSMIENPFASIARYLIVIAPTLIAGLLSGVFVLRQKDANAAFRDGWLGTFCGAVILGLLEVALNAPQFGDPHGNPFAGQALLIFMVLHAVLGCVGGLEAISKARLVE